MSASILFSCTHIALVETRFEEFDTILEAKSNVQSNVVSYESAAVLRTDFRQTL